MGSFYFKITYYLGGTLQMTSHLVSIALNFMETALVKAIDGL